MYFSQGFKESWEGLERGIVCISEKEKLANRKQFYNNSLWDRGAFWISHAPQVILVYLFVIVVPFTIQCIPRCCPWHFGV